MITNLQSGLCILVLFILIWIYRSRNIVCLCIARKRRLLYYLLNFFQVAPTVAEVFGSCMWRGNYVPCEDIFKIALTSEGVCFNFNALAASEMFSNRWWYYIVFAVLAAWVKRKRRRRLLIKYKSAVSVSTLRLI